MGGVSAWAELERRSAVARTGAHRKGAGWVIDTPQRKNARKTAAV
jgi:hypothetical protein